MIYTCIIKKQRYTIKYLKLLILHVLVYYELSYYTAVIFYFFFLYYIIINILWCVMCMCVFLYMLQILTAGWWLASKLNVARQRNERLRLVHFRLQFGARNWRKRIVATVRSIWSRAKRKGDPWPTDQQMQRLRFRNNDQLRWGSSSDSIIEWLHAW